MATSPRRKKREARSFRERVATAQTGNGQTWKQRKESPQGHHEWMELVVACFADWIGLHEILRDSRKYGAIFADTGDQLLKAISRNADLLEVSYLAFRAGESYANWQHKEDAEKRRSELAGKRKGAEKTKSNAEQSRRDTLREYWELRLASPRLSQNSVIEAMTCDGAHKRGTVKNYLTDAKIKAKTTLEEWKERPENSWFKAKP